MASPKASGRMIRRSISESEKIASLSPEAAVLFMMLIPHLNAHGKMQGGPGVVKDEVVPLIPYISYETTPGLLREISEKTNVKWFRQGAKWWIHALDFHDHQDLRADKMGSDDLPSWPETEVVRDDEPEVSDIVELPEQSGSSPGVVRDLPLRAEGLKVRREEEGQNQSFIGGGSGKTPRATPPPPDPPEGDEELEADVKRIRELHLEVCGLSSLPPLPMVREILLLGIPPSEIYDVYQELGGDVPKYRQRNIVERLKALRNGRERDPPAGKRGKLSASERRQEATFEACREFAGGDGDGFG